MDKSKLVWENCLKLNQTITQNICFPQKMKKSSVWWQFIMYLNLFSV